MIEPTPPFADVALPWDAPSPDPVSALAEARAAHGDTFAVHGTDTEYLFVFSPAGVRRFYEVEEEVASKGMADWRMLRRKLPDELFAGRRTMPHHFFGRAETADYLHVLESVLDSMVQELGADGRFDVFALTRTIGHRFGLGSWAGLETLAHPDLDELIDALDQLDGSDAFVRPEQMASVAAEGKATERQAMGTVERILGDTIGARRGRSDPPADLLQRIIDRWADVGADEIAPGVARDVILLHLGSMSNLFAALAWTIVDLVAHPAHRARVVAGEQGHAERCALESTRLAQRSVMLREVLRPCAVDDGTATYTLAPGATLATLLPLTNTSAAPALAHYDPDRWTGRRLRDVEGLPTRELVTVFGHGSHTCPAQPFALAAMTLTVQRLFGTFEFTPQYRDVTPRPGQIGGVARAAGACEVAFRRHDNPESVLVET